MGTFRARDAIRVSHLTYRQFDHAIRSGLLRPSRSGGSGRGSLRLFTVRDLLALVLLADVLRAGVHARAVIPALELVQRGHRLPPLDQLEEAAVWTNGKEAHLVQDGERPKTHPRSGAVSYWLHLGGALKRLRAELHESHVTI